jgi:hypothetical protein
MGFFKRPICRGRARAQKRTFVDAARGVDPALWTSAGGVLGASADSYLRFAVRPTSGEMIGLFQSCALIEQDPEVPRAALSQAREAFQWFNRHLAVPRRLPTSAVCWFRADAADCVDRVRTLVEVYRLAGHTVWMLGCRSPGRVVYRDAFQVAAIPHRGRRPVPTAC